DQVLHSVIIPLLPLYVCGTFIDMTKSGKTYAILGILWKVFLVVIIMHLVCIFLQFCVAGAVSHKSPFKMIRNQIPGYTTALGTQSSAATIPVNLQCAAADGVSEQIRNFVVPLCANIHMAGLNPAETEEAIQLIRKINESGVTILLIEHIMKAVVSLCEKVIVLHHGEKIAEGTPEQVMNDPYVMEVYLGTKKEGASA
ncbi:cation:dicarboxylate symporter family transporter, partial [Faecalibacterium prausnitzii]|uniref:cation:dicarboxylate symporter family transporter n=1 Tax=Faecalibacterium prausnitzii TaxID=853 RepID=UPI001A9A603C